VIGAPVPLSLGNVEFVALGDRALTASRPVHVA